MGLLFGVVGAWGAAVLRPYGDWEERAASESGPHRSEKVLSVQERGIPHSADFVQNDGLGFCSDAVVRVRVFGSWSWWWLLPDLWLWR